MQDFRISKINIMIKKYNSIIFFFAILLMFGCKKETTTYHQGNNYIYGIDGEVVYQSSAEKTKQKSPEQFVSILHSNLFQTSIDQNDLVNLSQIRRAIGDKQMADELILSAFLIDPAVVIVSESEMRADVENFIKQTYIRFFLREPTPYEIYDLKKIIDDDLDLTPELIYQAFALSNEYKFY